MSAKKIKVTAGEVIGKFTATTSTSNGVRVHLNQNSDLTAMDIGEVRNIFDKKGEIVGVILIKRGTKSEPC